MNKLRKKIALVSIVSGLSVFSNISIARDTFILDLTANNVSVSKGYSSAIDMFDSINTNDLTALNNAYTNTSAMGTSNFL